MIPDNAVGVDIQIVPNAKSPTPFPANLPIYVSLGNYPDPDRPGTYDFVTANNSFPFRRTAAAGDYLSANPERRI